MAHPQHNFTSNFNGSDGHNAELTLNINGVEKKYTPAGNDQTYNVPGVARIDINLDGADLVQAIQTALDGAAQPVLVEMSIYDEEVAYPYIGDLGGAWYFGVCTTNKIVTVVIDKEDGALTSEQIPVANGVVIVESDGLNVYSRLRTALALGQLPVLSYVGANPVYAQYEKTADNGDLIFVGALATASDTYVQYNIYTVHDNNTVTVTTRAASAGGGGTPDDENGFFNSSLYRTPGDGVTESLTLNDFSIKQGTSIHGSNIEFVPTHQEGGADFGEVWLNPGTYILNIRYTLQWVGNPRGTFAPLVCNVSGQPFDFSFEQENTLITSQIRVVTARQKVSIAFPFDADTPPMGIWVETLSIAQLASNTHPAVVHDTTLAGSGTAGSPLGVTTDAFGKIKDIPTSISQFRTGDVIPVDGPNGPAKMGKDDLLTETAQNALAGNMAPAFDPTRTSSNPYFVDDLVIYNTTIYRCRTEHYGPWNASHFAYSPLNVVLQRLIGSFVKTFRTSTPYKRGERVLNEFDAYEAKEDITAGDWDGTKWRSIPNFIGDSVVGMRAIAAGQYGDDLDNYPSNTILSCSKNTIGVNISHKPSDEEQFVVVTFGASFDFAAKVQILATIGGSTYIRRQWGTWSNWIKIETNDDIIKVSNPSVSGAPYDDLNTFPINSIVVFTMNSALSVANKPVETQFMCYTYAQYSGVVTQIFSDVDKETYVRTKWGSWGSWHKITNDEPANIFVAFDNIIYIGDSLTYSQVYTGTNTQRQAKRPWPNIVANLCNNTAEIFALPGDTAIANWTRYNEQVTAKTNALAVIYLGTNQGLTDTLSTDAPADESYTDWAETNTGCYAKWVAKLQSLGYKIMLVKCHGPEYVTTNSVIAQVGARFGCAVLGDMYNGDDKYHYYPDLSGRNVGHYNDLGYAWFASEIIKTSSRLPTAQMKYLIPV